MDIARIREELHRVRRRSEDIAAPIPDHVLAEQHHPLMGPLLWDLGHIAAFEELWLVKVLDGQVPPQGEMGLDARYNPFENPRAIRGQLELPGRAETLGHMADVRRESLQRLTSELLQSGNELTTDGFVWKMVAQHEEWHQETMLVAANLRSDLVFEPPFRCPKPQVEALDDTEMIEVSATTFELGTDDRTVAYDNERPAHRLEVAAFAIDRFPVSNRRYVRYVQATGAEPPLGWRREGDGSWAVRRFGRVLPLDPCEPVMHVSWHEARDFAAWEGKRLPTEVEWELAASWDPMSTEKRRYPWGDAPPSSERCNTGHGCLGPARIGAYPAGASAVGCEQMLGDVWEWVEDALSPYPGFAPWPYEEFTVPFFGSNRVLRGGSWATGHTLVRNTLRNWDLPVRRQVFTGFRCAVSR